MADLILKLQAYNDASQNIYYAIFGISMCHSGVRHTVLYLMEILTVCIEALNLIDLEAENSQLLHMTKADEYLLFTVYEFLFIH